MVIDRDGELLLGLVLADDVTVQERLDLGRPRQPLVHRIRLLPLFFFENLLADIHTFVADVGSRVVRGRTDQFLDLLLRLMAEGTAQRLVRAEFSQRCDALRRIKDTISPVRIILGHFASSVHRRFFLLLTVWNLLAVLGDDLVDQAVLLGLNRGHDKVALHVFLNFFDRLAAVLGQKPIDHGAHAQDFLRVDINIGGLAGQTRHPRLVNQDAGVGQRESLFRRARGQQQRGDRSALADTNSHDGGPHELHRVINCHSCRDRAARRIDVQRYVFLRIREFWQSQSRVFSLRILDFILSSAPCLVKFARTAVTDSPLRCAIAATCFSTSSSVTSMFSAVAIRSSRSSAFTSSTARSFWRLRRDTKSTLTARGSTPCEARDRTVRSSRESICCSTSAWGTGNSCDSTNFASSFSRVCSFRRWLRTASRFSRIFFRSSSTVCASLTSFANSSFNSGRFFSLMPRISTVYE